MDEVKHCSGSCFVTLTYNDENLPKNGTLVVEDCQKFFKRLRKKYDKEIRYYLGAEYGEKGRRPHYHVVLFGLTQADTKQIESAWGLGYVSVLPVTWDSACYVARYTEKKLYGDAAVDYVGRGVIPEFSLMSRRPGIGAKALDLNRDFLYHSGHSVVDGAKTKLPRYYSDRLYTTEDEKSVLKKKREILQLEQEEIARQKCGENSIDEVRWYMRQEDFQALKNLKIQQAMKRRKL